VAIAGKWARRTRDSVPAADRGCRGLSGRGAGNPRLPLAWPVLAALDHRQFGRAFVLSIGEAGHEATTAPVSSGAGWRSPASGPGRRRDSATAADRSCRGLVRLSGCGQSAVAAGVARAGSARSPAVRSGSSFSRSVKPATRRRRRQCRAVPGGDRRQVVPGRRRDSVPAADRALPWPGQDLGVLAGFRGASTCAGLPLAWPVLATLDHRQFGRAFVLSIGEAGHEATTAPASSGAWWRSPASGPGRTRDSAPAADRGCRGVGRLSGCAGIGADVRQGCRRRGSCWQCSITGSSVGPSFSRSVKPAKKRRRRQCRAVPGGDRRQVGQVEGETAQRLPIGVAVAWSGRGAGNPRLPLAWPVLAVLDHRQFGRAFVLSIGEAGHEATTAPASSGAWWRSPASGARRTRDSATAADRSCRGLVRLSGCLQAIQTVAAGVARAGGARSSAVRSGFRPLDR
jgi:hypothetical protein